ncbi:hypothetical protein AVEN_23200-1 [Araneus ventricosus]|uniref:Uncharacterized protein n=1 Tax=Araneus ventricosus TaxID=182803 RepID=A0A4Y2QCT9_ARAVE|nr:hypothetical protein AVEN_23200-1 [Araneus ventricosus]
MLEYEFRLMVSDPDPFQLLNRLNQPQLVYKVVYAKPHFRFKEGCWEIKEIIQNVAVYHNHLWFRWVQSKEIPFRSWNLKMHSTFFQVSGFYQNPFIIEYRKEVRLDSKAKIYAFRKKKESGLVFEYESKKGIFNVNPLDKYITIFDLFFRNKPSLPYKIKPCTRKTVKPVKEIKSSCLVARKYDGIFGFVYSYSDHIFELWEDNFQRVRKDVTLGDGIVFSAEKMDDVVVLLDVYQVRGVVTMCRESIFLEFLPRLELPLGYRIQNYCRDVSELPPTDLKTDGLIFHDTKNDNIYKLKKKHTYDLVYRDGYLYFPQNIRAPVKEKLKNGHVYEVSRRGRIIRERPDRFVGNSAKQIENLLECGSVWIGPKIEKYVQISKKGRRRKSKKITKK